MLSQVFTEHSASFNAVAFSDDIKKFGLEKLQPGAVNAYCVITNNDGAICCFLQTAEIRDVKFGAKASQHIYSATAKLNLIPCPGMELRVIQKWNPFEPYYKTLAQIAKMPRRSALFSNERMALKRSNNIK